MRTLPIVLIALSLFACSGDKPPEPATPTPSATASTPPEPPSAMPSAVASAMPSASASADASATAKPSTGRPPVLKTDPVEAADTFGYSPAAKLQVGEKDFATLKIPENALKTATNVTFKIEKSGKSNGPPVGKIYHVIAVVPPATSAEPLPTNGPPFEVVLPAGAKKDANLAVGEITVDNNGREKIKWSIIAPTKIDDVSNLAYFELQALGNLYIHVTTKAPAAAK